MTRKVGMEKSQSVNMCACVFSLCTCSNYQGRFLSLVLIRLGINLHTRFPLGFSAGGSRAPGQRLLTAHAPPSGGEGNRVHLCLVVELVLVEGVSHPKLTIPFRILAAREAHAPYFTHAGDLQQRALLPSAHLPEVEELSGRVFSSLVTPGAECLQHP